MCKLWQTSQILFLLQAFLRIEKFCFRTGLTWFEAKIEIVREAVKAYLRYLKYVLTAFIFLGVMQLT